MENRALKIFGSVGSVPLSLGKAGLISQPCNYRVASNRLIRNLWTLTLLSTRRLRKNHFTLPPVSRVTLSWRQMTNMKSIQASRTVTLLNSNNRLVPAFSLVKSMKKSLTRGYEAGIIEGINSLSISPSCAICQNRIARILSWDLFYTSLRCPNGLRDNVKIL